MENEQADRWQSFPILATASEKGKYLTIISLQAPTPDARPDRTPQPENLWEVYGPHWWSALHSLSAEDTIVFDTETTGDRTRTWTRRSLSRCAATFRGAQGAQRSSITASSRRAFPRKVLEQNVKG